MMDDDVMMPVSLCSRFDNVYIAVRVRPLTKDQIQPGDEKVVSIDAVNNMITLTRPLPNAVGKSFRLDHIFPEDSTEKNIYETMGKPIVKDVLNGYNATVFAYGQIGSGKTHTMIGKSTRNGFILNAFAHIFKAVSTDTEPSAITVTYVEIYNECVSDLLVPKPNQLQLKKEINGGSYISGVTTVAVNSMKAAAQLLRRGGKNRATRSHLKNNVSSKSNALLTIQILRTNFKRRTLGKINFVDFAGHEQVEDIITYDDSINEANNINRSLSSFGIVISAVVNEQQSALLYRCSKLTRLLEDSLGGGSKMAMFFRKDGESTMPRGKPS